jgi:hypothetical protein
VPKKIEDPQNLDERRSELGLEPEARYLAEQSKNCAK